MNSTTNRVPCTAQDFIKILKSAALALIFLSTYTTSFSAAAECFLDNPSLLGILRDKGENFTYKIDASLPVGSKLYETTLYSQIGTADKFTCTGDHPIARYESGFKYSGNGIYETGITGIGMKINSFHPDVQPPNEVNILAASGTENTYIIQYYFVVLITFIKTGYIPVGGQIFGPPLIQSTIINHNNLPFSTAYLTQPLNIILNRATCTLNTPNLTVNLGEVSISDFNAGGRTTPVNFNIDLNCEGGTRPADVYVTLTDANNPGNTSTQLGLSPDSDARGIALEVNNKFGAVTFGPDLNGTGNPGQWLEGAAGVGGFSIPLSVNYVRLGGPIKGGTANSGVTYTLNYD